MIPVTTHFRLLLHIVLFGGSICVVYGQRKFIPVAVEKYIQKYKDLAIGEMCCSRIPASVKMAQGILESHCGDSGLVQKSNNHFGIKCKENWMGESVNWFDDDYDPSGKHIRSCFRKYPCAESSWYDHTDFLSQRKYYQSLFTLSPLDYKGWCRGLKKCGYATVKDYDRQLIAIIEHYHLAHLDTLGFKTMNSTKPLVAEGKYKSVFQLRSKTDPMGAAYTLAQVDSIKLFGAKNTAAILASGYCTQPRSKRPFYNAKKRAVMVRNADTPASIAKRMHIRLRKLLRYNELSKKDSLTTGTYIYLESKSALPEQPLLYHEVRPGETIYSISQLYGISNHDLHRYNRIPRHQEVYAGTRIIVSGHAKQKIATCCTRAEKQSEAEDFVKQLQF